MRDVTHRYGPAFVFAALLVAGLAFTGDDAARATTKYDPVCNVKDIMKALNDEEPTGFYGMLKAFADGNPEKGDDAWTIMRHRAAMMAEGGQLLTELDAPKGDAKSWVEKATAFSDACKGLKRPLALQKADKLKEQLAVVRKACDTCHDAHRPE